MFAINAPLKPVAIKVSTAAVELVAAREASLTKPVDVEILTAASAFSGEISAINTMNMASIIDRKNRMALLNKPVLVDARGCFDFLDISSSAAGATLAFTFLRNGRSPPVNKARRSITGFLKTSADEASAAASAREASCAEVN